MYKLKIWALYYMLVKSHEFMHANHLYITLPVYYHLRVYNTGRISLQTLRDEVRGISHLHRIVEPTNLPVTEQVREMTRCHRSLFETGPSIPKESMPLILPEKWLQQVLLLCSVVEFGPEVY